MGPKRAKKDTDPRRKMNNKDTDTVLQKAFALINNNRVDEFLVAFTQFHNRRGDTYQGKLSQLFLSSKIVETLRDRMEEKRPATVKEFGPESVPQKTLIVKLPGAAYAKRPVLVMAHQDSISGDSKDQRAPGWDDNGSGTAALLESLKVICDLKVRFYQTVEFVFSRAEELGLKGSSELAKHYSKENVKLDSVLNIDSIAYLPNLNSKRFGLVTDGSTEELAEFLQKIILKHTDFTAEKKRCDYSCGDSFPFKSHGYRTVMLESFDENDRHHTPNDTKTPNSEIMLREGIKTTLAFIFKRAKVVSVNGNQEEAGDEESDSGSSSEESESSEDD